MNEFFFSERDGGLSLQETHRLAYARLNELANGVEPVNRQNGICRELNVVLRGMSRGYVYCGWLFTQLGLDETNPLGDYGDNGDLWEGIRGARRRELAARMANYIKEHFL